MSISHMATQLWWVRPETIAAKPALLALLDAQERAQQQRYIPPAKRHEHLVTRLLVRSVLGKMLDMAPEALQFVLNEWGRPALASGSMPSPINFNVSHTEGLIVCIVSTEHQVGVDTELLARAPTLLALAPTVFAPRELSDLAALPLEQQAQRAVHLWTLKESYIKARGMGLALPLDGFAFRFDADAAHLTVQQASIDDGINWQFQTRTFGAHLISTAIALPPDQHHTETQPATNTTMVPISYEEFCWPG